MISGATRGRGGDKLARHLMKGGQAIEPRHLGGEDLKEQLRGLVAGASHGRTGRPVYHVHCDPVGDQAEQMRTRFFELFESEFGLEDQPMCGAVHASKDGRPDHEHRAYSLVRDDGSVIDLSHDYARREKVARIIEHEFGQPFVVGKHNRAVHSVLLIERPDVAAAMELAGLLDVDRPSALSPQDRHQQERTKVSKSEVQAAAWTAWKASDDGKSLETALANSGLRLAQGDKAAVIVDATGNTHPLARLISAAAKAEGEKIPAKIIKERIANTSLPSVEQARQAIGDVKHDTATEAPRAAEEAQAQEPVNQPEADPGEADLRRDQGDAPESPDDHRHADRSRRERPTVADGADHRTPGASPSGSAAPRHATQRDRKVAHRLASIKLDTAGSAAGRRERLQAILDDAKRLTETPSELARRIRLEARTATSRASRPEDASVILKERLRPLKAASTEAFWTVADAEKAVEGHRSSKPKGILAAITCRTRQWRQRQEQLQVQLEEARAAHSGARDTLNEASISMSASARRQAMDNMRDNMRDTATARKLSAAAEAIEVGDRDTIAAARAGDRSALLEAGQAWARQQAEQQKRQELERRRGAKVRKPKRSRQQDSAPSVPSM